MPTSQAVWGIEIGQCALKAIRLRVDPESKKVEALAFDYIEHPKILSQPDADPDALSREALQTFLSRNVIKGDRVAVGVPGQSGLARFIKLPPVEPSRIPEIVKYEARQQIPFALEEVVWDFQTIGQAEEAGGFALETEIGLFAMKRDLIYRFMNPFRESSVEVDVVQMRPLAVYNFGAFDQMPAPSTAKEKDEEEEEEKEESEYQREELVEGAKKKPEQDTAPGFIVLLDMGADNSDLVITNGTRIWQRNLPIGGNHFTRALTKELKLTFAKAEHLKRNATKAQDPRAIFQAMRPVFNDLVSEIQRSIGYFSSVHRQSKITKIIGMGNAFKLPGLQKFLAQNLQYEVEKVETLTCLKGDQVLSAPAFQENILSFTVVYGLAIQALGVASVRTNLLPPEIEQARMIRRKKPWALTAAAILMAGFTCLFFGNWSQLHAVNSPAFAGPEAKGKSALELKQSKETAYNAVKSQWSDLKSKGEGLTSNVEKRLEWIEVLNIISNALPQNPANIDRKDLLELSEVQITSIVVNYYDDVKGWYDKVVTDPTTWAQNTRLPLDEKEPPAGAGWVFTLEGYHFHKAARTHTTYALLGPPLPDGQTGFQSPVVRETGIRAAMIIENWYQGSWIPGTEVKTARRARRERSGGGSTSGARGGSSASMGGMASGGGMGGIDSSMGLNRGNLDDSGDGRESARDRSQNMGQRGSGDFAEGLAGELDPGGGAQGASGVAGGSAPIVRLGKTDFVLEFAWQPVDKKTRAEKNVGFWVDAIRKHGARSGQTPDYLLKLVRPIQQPKQDAAGGTTNQGTPTGTPQAPQGQPPGGSTPGGLPGGAGVPGGGVQQPPGQPPQ